MSIEKVRLDDRMVLEGLVANKSQAKSLIMAGKVLVNEKKIDKAGTPTKPEDVIRLLDLPSQYVSRGGFKLAGALDHFKALSVLGRLALDIGASTGGFTDCLLQRGVSKVYAVDVGYGQLAWKLREDPRVINIERCNFRYLEAGYFPEKIEVVVADLSFISLEKILEPLKRHLAEGADAVLLVKPQFEVGKGQVGSGGVVRDPKLRAEAIERVIHSACALGYRYIDGCDSSLAGPKGNLEYLIWLKYFQSNGLENTLAQRST